MASTIDDVLRQMAERGIEPPTKAIYADGKKYTWAGTAGKPKKINAWCILNEWTSPRTHQVYIGGVYGIGDQSNFWKIEHEQKEWTPAEKSDWLAKRKEIERAAEEDRKTTATAAAEKAKKHWDGANETGGSAYLERKQVGAYGVRFIYGKVLVPLFDTADKLHGLQWIQEDGSKVFGTGTVKEGHFHLIGNITEGLPLAFAEGYATAATVHMATGWPVVVCFDAGNLMPVVAEFRKLYESHEFIIAGDDDKHLVKRLCERLQLVGVDVKPDFFSSTAGGLRDMQWTLPGENGWATPHVVKLMAAYAKDRNDVRLIEGSITVGDSMLPPLRIENAGRAKAMAVAKKHGARAVFPRFEVRSDTHTDFNDMHVAEGLPKVRELLMKPPPPVVVKPKKSIAPPDGEDGGYGGGGHYDDPDGESGSGRKHLRFPYRTDKGEVKGIRENVYHAFNEDPVLQGLVRFNEFSHRLDKTRQAPWDGPTAVAGKWGALDDLRLANYLAESHRLIVANPVTIEQAVMMAACDAAYNPLKDYCEGLVWDGVERRHTWLHTVLGAENSEYHTLVGTYFILSMIARVYEPGCQMDYMMILQGAQGAKKSSVLRILGGEYFAGGTFRVGDKDSLQVLQGRWIFNFNEIDSLNKSEATANKAFITERVDVFRPPYGKQFVDYPRSCVLTGDTNEDEFLKDGTGDRRSWVVHCSNIDVEAMAAMRDQLIAEAVHFYKAGDQRYPDKATEDRVFKPKQEEWKFVDVWQDALARYVNGTAVTENYPGCTGNINDGQCRDRECFSTLELMLVGLKIENNKIDNAGGQQKRVAKLMRALGFSKFKFSTGGRENGYRRILRPEAIKVASPVIKPAAGTIVPAHAGSSGLDANEEAF